MSESEKVDVSCPSCPKVFRAPKAALGRIGRCAGCGEQFLMEALLRTRAPEKSAPVAVKEPPPRRRQPFEPHILWRFVGPSLAVFWFSIAGFIAWKESGRRAKADTARRKQIKRQEELQRKQQARYEAAKRAREAEVKAQKDQKQQDRDDLKQGRFRGRALSQWLQGIQATVLPKETHEALFRIANESPEPYKIELYKAVKLRLLKSVFFSSRSTLEYLLKKVGPSVRDAAVLDVLEDAIRRSRDPAERYDLRTISRELDGLAYAKAKVDPGRLRRLNLALALEEATSTSGSRALERCLGYGEDWPETKEEQRLFVQVLEKARAGKRQFRQLGLFCAALRRLADKGGDLGDQALRSLVLCQRDSFEVRRKRKVRGRKQVILLEKIIDQPTALYLKAQKARVRALLPAIKTELTPEREDFFKQLEELLDS